MSDKFLILMDGFFEQYGKLSTAFLQRKLRISYEQAKKLMKLHEEKYGKN